MTKQDPSQRRRQAITHTVFSNPPKNTSEQNEGNKISYWLKKLFEQRAQKVIDDKKLADNKLASQSKVVENNAPRIKPGGKSYEQKDRAEDVQTFSQEQHAKDKLLTEEMLRKSNREVLSISTVFPWDLFPTIIRIQENKVSFIFHQFMTSQEQDVDIKDISNTYLEQSFLFARLKIISNTFANEPVIIDHLRKKDAVRARMYIQGLQLFNQQNIDTSDYEIEELIQKLEKLQTDKYNDDKKKQVA
jgi:hypothetical protein